MSTDHAFGTDASPFDGQPVDVSYQHANPKTGNESILLRFGYEGRPGHACLLIDAGEEVDIDTLLGPDDHLVGTCLTHAHLDHYQSLPTCVRDGGPLFVSPATATILDEVLDVAAEHHDLATTSALEEAVVEVEGWTDVCPGVQLHPIPAGHAPGAVGYVVRFEDAAGPHDILVTGDFTFEACAGHPGFDLDISVNVEALFLSGATAEPPGEVLTDALGDALTQALDGGRTLLTTGALTGVQMATLLAAANDAFTLDVPVRLVGQAAKLFDRLCYSHPAVETVPVFDDPHSCLTPGTISVAGPEVPSHDSSGRMYGALKHDATAGVVQVITGGHSPVRSGGCTTTAHSLAMHPPESVLRTVVERLEPAQTVMTHCRSTPKRYNEWPTCVWSPGDDEVHTLYVDGTWQRPPWMAAVQQRDTSAATRLSAVATEAFAALPLPPLDRKATPILADEGINVERLADRLEAASSHSPADEEAADHETQATTGTEEPTTDNTDDTDSTDIAMSDAPSRENETEPRLYATTVKPLEGDVEPPAAFEETLPSADNLVASRARKQLLGEVTDGAAQAEDGMPAADDGDAAEVEEMDRSDDSTGSPTNEPRADSDAGPPEPTDAPHCEVDDLMSDDQDTTEPDDVTEEKSDSSGTSTEVTSAIAVTLNPLITALVDTECTGDDRSRGEFVADAVETYLAGLIGGDVVVASDDDPLHVEFTGALGPAVPACLDTDGDGVQDAVIDALGAHLGVESSVSVSVSLGRCRSLLDAVVETHSDAFDTPTDVIDAAIVRAVTDK